MATGVFHLSSDVFQSLGATLRAKFIRDAADRVSEAVAQGTLAAGFLHADRNSELRLRELRVSFLGKVNHVAIR